MKWFELKCEDWEICDYLNKLSDIGIPAINIKIYPYGILYLHTEEIDY